MKDFYVPEGITDDYCYIVPSNGYYDLYNTNYLNSNQNYNYYRFYDNVDSDMYQLNTRNVGFNGVSLNAIQIVPKHSFTYRRDFPQILTSAFIVLFGLVILINIFTSIIKKGGVLSGLI